MDGLLYFLLGALASWFSTRYYYVKGIEAQKNDLRYLNQNLNRLLIKEGIVARRLSLREIGAMESAARKSSSLTDRKGEVVLRYCIDCGSDLVERKRPSYEDIEENRYLGGVVIRRGEKIVKQSIIFYFTPNNSYMWKCLTCGKQELNFLKSFEDSLPEDDFKITPSDQTILCLIPVNPKKALL